MDKEFDLSENFIAWRCSIESDAWECGDHYRYTKKDGDKLEETLKEFIKKNEEDFITHRNIAQYKHPEGEIIVALCNELIDIMKKNAGKHLVGDNSSNEYKKPSRFSKDTPVPFELSGTGTSKGCGKLSDILRYRCGEYYLCKSCQNMIESKKLLNQTKTESMKNGTCICGKSKEEHFVYKGELYCKNWVDKKNGKKFEVRK